jgi:hypothetical protein
LAARVLDFFGDEDFFTPNFIAAAEFAGDPFTSVVAPSAADLGDLEGDDARLDLAGEGAFSTSAASSAPSPSACAAEGCVRAFFGDGAAFFALLAAARAFPISTSATVRFPPLPPDADIPAAASAVTSPARFARAATVGLFSPDLAAAVVRRRGEAEEAAAEERRGRMRREGRRRGGGAARPRVLGAGGG